MYFCLILLHVPRFLIPFVRYLGLQICSLIFRVDILIVPAYAVVLICVDLWLRVGILSKGWILDRTSMQQLYGEFPELKPKPPVGV